MRIKESIRMMVTAFMHPLLTASLYSKGGRWFFVGPSNKIKGIKYIKIGKNVTIGKDARIMCIDEYNGRKYFPKLTIGNNVYISYRLSVLAASSIKIEDNVLVASGVVITSENHGINPENELSYKDNDLEVKDIHIGKGCWIGENAIILPGVHLGEKCIVAAGTIVTKSFPAYSMIAGVPGKVIKKYDFLRHAWIAAKN